MTDAEHEAELWAYLLTIRPDFEIPPPYQRSEWCEVALLLWHRLRTIEEQMAEAAEFARRAQAICDEAQK